MPNVVMQDGSKIPIGNISKMSDEDLDKLISALEPVSPKPDLNNLPPPVDPYAWQNLRIPSTEEMLASTPPPIDLSSLPERIPGILKESIKKGALPALGAGAGAALGAMIGPIAVPALESLGSLGGEYANQQFGITEPSNFQLGLAAAGPPIIRGAGAVFDIGRKLIGPGNAARTLNVNAADEMTNFVNDFRSQVPSKTLFERAQVSGALVNLQDTYDEAGRLLKQLKLPASEFRSKDLISQLESLRSWIKPSAEKIERQAGYITSPPPINYTPNPMTKTPSDLQAQLEKMGEDLGSLSGSDYGKMRKLFKTMIQDIEKEAAKSEKNYIGNIKNIGEGSGAQDLLDAREAFKREMSIQTLIDYINKASPILKGQGGDIQFSAKQVIDKIKKDEFFTQSFTSDEQADIFGLLKKLNTIPSLKPGAGQNVGSYNRVGQLITGSALGSTAYLASHDPTMTAIAGLTGTFMPPVMNNISIIAQILSLKSGRTMLKNMLKTGPLTTADLGTLTAFLTAQKGQLSDSGINPLTQIPPEFQGINNIGGNE